jgi:Protein of unknown function (DUF3761)
MFLGVVNLAAAAVAAGAIGLASPDVHAGSDGSDCPPGYYQAASGDCVPDPKKGAADRPPTAICKDGDYLYRELPHSRGTCHGHDGVAQVLAPQRFRGVKGVMKAFIVKQKQVPPLVSKQLAWKGVVRRAELPLDGGGTMVGDKVTITLALEALKQA